jgi:hypothetical protein
MVYDAPMIRRVACLLFPLVAACASGPRSSSPSGSSGQAEAVGPVDGPLKTAGARCSGPSCRCRPVDAHDRGTEGKSAVEGDIAPGTKRFEIRTGRGFDKTTITVGDRGSLKKDTTQTEPSCGYIDLPPGRHAVRLRVEAQDRNQGIHPRLLISEYGKESHDWYDTFAFACGGAQPCLKDDMPPFLDEVRRVQRGIFDKCGSTRVENVRWSVEHSPEMTMEDLTLELTLHVYKFDPRFPHGAPNCRGLAGGKAAEQELAE